MFDLAVYTTAATAATIGPVYKIRKFLGKLYKIPFLGWIIALGYGTVMSMILLKLFAFQSSMAGLANLLSSIAFSIWMYMQKGK